MHYFSFKKHRNGPALSFTKLLSFLTKIVFPAMIGSANTDFTLVMVLKNCDTVEIF